jgi:hypothetical protein
LLCLSDSACSAPDVSPFFHFCLGLSIHPRPRRCSSCSAAKTPFASLLAHQSGIQAISMSSGCGGRWGRRSAAPVRFPLLGLASLRSSRRFLARARTHGSDLIDASCDICFPGALSSNPVEHHLDGKYEERLCIGGAYMGALCEDRMWSDGADPMCYQLSSANTRFVPVHLRQRTGLFFMFWQRLYLLC